MSLPTIVGSPSVSVCFLFLDLLDRKWIETKFGRDIAIRGLVEGQTQAVRHIKRTLTVDEILAHTPSVNDAYGYGYIRDDQSYDMDFLGTSNRLRQEFKISRYLALEYICYQVQRSTKKEFNYELLSKSEFRAQLFSFAFPKSMANRTTTIIPIVHGSQYYPYTSMVLSRKNQFSAAPSLNAYRLSGQLIVNNLLPSPYVTDCIDYYRIFGKGRAGAESDYLIKSTIERLGHLPFGELKEPKIIEKYPQLRIKFPFDYGADNGSFIATMKAIRSKSHRLFRKPDCEGFYYATRFVAREKWGNLKGLIVSVELPADLTIESVYKPIQDFYTFAVLVLSCFGVWLGWSIIDFSPTKLVELCSRGSTYVPRNQTVQVSRRHSNTIVRNSYTITNDVKIRRIVLR